MQLEQMVMFIIYRLYTNRMINYSENIIFFHCIKNILLNKYETVNIKKQGQ